MTSLIIYVSLRWWSWARITVRVEYGCELPLPPILTATCHLLLSSRRPWNACDVLHSVLTDEREMSRTRGGTGAAEGLALHARRHGVLREEGTRHPGGKGHRGDGEALRL